MAAPKGRVRKKRFGSKIFLNYHVSVQKKVSFEGYVLQMDSTNDVVGLMDSPYLFTLCAQIATAPSTPA